MSVLSESPVVWEQSEYGSSYTLQGMRPFSVTVWYAAQSSSANDRGEREPPYCVSVCGAKMKNRYNCIEDGQAAAIALLHTFLERGLAKLEAMEK
jgi:hypothetical protein